MLYYQYNSHGDDIYKSIIQSSQSLRASVNKLLWHEDTGNETYCLNQTEKENEMLKRREDVNGYPIKTEYYRNEGKYVSQYV